MELENSLLRYDLLEVIGKGAYGVVHRAKDLEENKIVALKKIEMKESKEGISSTILREVGILKRLDHPNIVSIKDFFMENDNCYIVFEYLPQDLKKFIESLETPLPECMIKYYLHQLISALSYCHANCIIHRDLKPQNLLMVCDKLKIADFGLSRLSVSPHAPLTPTVQSLWYRAPELLLGSNYNEKIDMWSVGCIFAELITGAPIFPGNNQIDQLWTIFKIIGTPDQDTLQKINQLKGFCEFPKWEPMNFKEFFQVLSEDGIDFLNKVLVFDPNKRISARQALQHQYFREFNYVSRNKP